MAHINLKNLSIKYINNTVLKDITIDIPDSQITAIIGPSGCGKTTLLKSINRLLDLYEHVKVKGEVMVDGINMYDKNTDLLVMRKKIGFLSQKPYPLPMSIYKNISFGPKIHRMTKKEINMQIEELKAICPVEENNNKSCNKKSEMDNLVEYYLKLSGLWDEVKDRLHSPAVKLSVGQQQRLALARALAVNPSVILADEPTSALDPVSGKLIEKQFQYLKKNYTILFVTHILRQAKRIADYVVFMYMGELVEHGSAKEIFNFPKDERTKAYISGEIS
jgi:phosphate transport system ATP-binding protein